MINDDDNKFLENLCKLNIYEVLWCKQQQQQQQEN